MSHADSDARPAPDPALADIAAYVSDYKIESAEAYRAARYCVMDAIGCAIEALKFPDCTRLLGSIVPGMRLSCGARVPGTQFELDPVSAAFSIGTMIRWIDLNDTFTAGDGTHPSDNLGGILATADYLSRKRVAEGGSPLLMREVLTALIKVYEIQGVLSLENSLTQLGYDPASLTRVATAAVATQMLGGSRDEIVNAVSNAWVDGVCLRIFRQGANTGSRKNWATGDATSRGVWLALMALKGEMGYPQALTAKKFGFHEVLNKGQPLKFQRPYGHYIVENVRFKFYPAAMLAQSSGECAFKLHQLVRERLDDVEAIAIKCPKASMGTVNKQGPLSNVADRDHCVQYIVAVGLMQGKLDASDYEDEFAADPRIDRLRAKMTVIEEPRYTRDFHDPEKRSNASSVEVRFRDGSRTPEVEVEYTAGHPRNRAEGMPMLEAKFRTHMAHRFPQKQQAAILDLCLDQGRFETTPVNEFLETFVI